ncbi:MAG: hypothetical protein U9P14_07180, partial [Gemmatimonadota bacterium]|nr:hypothetical protein [Gemmatimonadota bacterium]
IREKVIDRGASALWLYAPGLINPDSRPRLNVRNMKEITGFDFSFKTGGFHPRIVLDDPRHPIVERLPRDRWFGWPDRPMFGSFETKRKHQIIELTPSLTDPVFFLAESSQVAGGYFFGEGLEDGLGAIGDIPYPGGGHSIYIGTKYVQSALLRETARRAGVHLYSESGDVLYADANFVVIHARTGGLKRLNFPRSVDVWEVFEKKLYGRKVKELKFKMKFGQTKVFCLRGKI